VEGFKQAFLGILALELGELVGGHFAFVGRQGTVDFAADCEQSVFVGVGAEGGG
jgi:hypothetical protein